MPSPDERDRAGFGALLSQTTRQWRRAVDRHMQPFGLTEATWLPLLRLSRAKAPMRQKELAASLALDGSSVVRLIDQLEASGFVRREEEAEDRRAKAILLTASGRAVARRAETIARRVREEALAGVPARDVEATLRVLAHVCATLEAQEGVA
jgi:MarR family transcriptional regulator for hemolysin